MKKERIATTKKKNCENCCSLTLLQVDLLHSDQLQCRGSRQTLNKIDRNRYRKIEIDLDRWEWIKKIELES